MGVAEHLEDPGVERRRGPGGVRLARRHRPGSVEYMSASSDAGSRPTAETGTDPAQAEAAGCPRALAAYTGYSRTRPARGLRRPRRPGPAPHPRAARRRRAARGRGGRGDRRRSSASGSRPCSMQLQGAAREQASPGVRADGARRLTPRRPRRRPDGRGRCVAGAVPGLLGAATRRARHRGRPRHEGCDRDGPSSTTSRAPRSTRRSGCRTTCRCGARARRHGRRTASRTPASSSTSPSTRGWWLPEDHSPLRLSGIQSGNSSGPVGSTDGQQAVYDGQWSARSSEFAGHLQDGGHLSAAG